MAFISPTYCEYSYISLKKYHRVCVQSAAQAAHTSGQTLGNVDQTTLLTLSRSEVRNIVAPRASDKGPYTCSRVKLWFPEEEGMGSAGCNVCVCACACDGLIWVPVTGCEQNRSLQLDIRMLEVSVFKQQNRIHSFIHSFIHFIWRYHYGWSKTAKFKVHPIQRANYGKCTEERVLGLTTNPHSPGHGEA